VVIAIDDDGVGFPADAGPPWSIVSRVRELDGWVRVARDAGPGGHLMAALPQS
jgi:signal transduction histidine kinase